MYCFNKCNPEWFRATNPYCNERIATKHTYHRQNPSFPQFKLSQLHKLDFTFTLLVIMYEPMGVYWQKRTQLLSLIVFVYICKQIGFDIDHLITLGL